MTRLESLKAQLAQKQRFRTQCQAVPQYQVLTPHAEIAALEKAIADEEALQAKIAAARAKQKPTL